MFLIMALTRGSLWLPCSDFNGLWTRLCLVGCGAQGCQWFQNCLNSGSLFPLFCTGVLFFERFGRQMGNSIATISVGRCPRTAFQIRLQNLRHVVARCVKLRARNRAAAPIALQIQPVGVTSWAMKANQAHIECGQISSHAERCSLFVSGCAVCAQLKKKLLGKVLSVLRAARGDSAMWTPNCERLLIIQLGLLSCVSVHLHAHCMCVSWCQLLAQQTHDVLIQLYIYPLWFEFLVLQQVLWDNAPLWNCLFYLTARSHTETRIMPVRQEAMFVHSTHATHSLSASASLLKSMQPLQQTRIQCQYHLIFWEHGRSISIVFHGINKEVGNGHRMKALRHSSRVESTPNEFCQSAPLHDACQWNVAGAEKTEFTTIHCNPRTKT